MISDGVLAEDAVGDKDQEMGNGTEIFLVLMRADIKLEEGRIPDLLVLDKHGIIIHKEIIVETIPVGYKTKTGEQQGDPKIFFVLKNFLDGLFAGY